MRVSRFGNDFGLKIKELRLSLNYSLRGFCLEYGLDPGNLSKIERGILPPPKDISKYAKAFKIKKGSEQWKELEDLALKSLAAESFVNVEDEVAKRLPQFFRTIDNENLTSEKLDKIIQYLKEN